MSTLNAKFDHRATRPTHADDQQCAAGAAARVAPSILHRVKGAPERAASAGGTDRTGQSPGMVLRLWVVWVVLLLSATAPVVGGAEIRLPEADPMASIVIAADVAEYWTSERQEDVWVLIGSCSVGQGDSQIRGSRGIVWLRRGDPDHRVPFEATVFMEGDVQLVGADEQPLATVVKGYWLGVLESNRGAQLEIGSVQRKDVTRLQLYQHANLARLRELPPAGGAVQPAQFSAPDWIRQAPPSELPGGPAGVASARRIQIRPRGSNGYLADSFPRGEEFITVVNNGVNIRIYGYAETGVIDILADRLVVWTSGIEVAAMDFDPQDRPVEFYLEGNIVFRQGRREIRADRMYYDVQGQYGVVLNAEVLAPATLAPGPGQYEGYVRLKSDVLRQIDGSRFEANNAAVTTSRMGVPRYWLQADTLLFENYQQPLVDSLGNAPLDPRTNEPLTMSQQFATARGAALFLAGWPIFQWPSFTANLNRPSYYLDSVQVGNDNVFGAQLQTDWNLFQIFGLNQPENVGWTAAVDYLSDRGLGVGSDLQYESDQFWGWPGWTKGNWNAWFINDGGLDNLGRDRREVPLEEDFRGRLSGRHRQRTPGGWQISAELGWLSDRNFLEQYYEQEWDTEKDLTTGLEIKRLVGSGSWSVSTDLRVNDFFTQTEWLPRLDHFQLGHSLWGDRLTWYEHSQVGYARFRTADPPTNPVDLQKFDPLAWESNDTAGLRLASRQEVDLPLQWGAVRVVPYLLGEIAYWQEDLAGDKVTRLFGQTGVRLSLPWWRVDPAVRDQLFNLNGLAHKVTFESEVLVADANQNYDRFPLYDPLDDDALEFARRRYLFDTYGGTFGENAPLKFDERAYALRTGLQSAVASPSTEIADDLMAVRYGVQQRWQTKRGLPGQERIIDWLTFDVDGFLYPRADRDNFGQEVGPVIYDLSWHVGDRTTILSDGHFDFFNQGLRTISLGTAVTRPGKTQYYLGLRSIEGPISSNIVTSSATYRLSPKWIMNYGSTFDFGSTGNIGQSGGIIRIGESFLIRLGFLYDASRDNFGLRFSIEPRFFSQRLGVIGGRSILPVGVQGLD